MTKKPSDSEPPIWLQLVSLSLIFALGSEELQRWFASIPAGTPTERKFKQKALQTVALHLEHRDLETAKRWLETQPPEPWRSSPACALVAKKLAKTDRALALNWLAAVPRGAAPVGREAGKEIYQAWQREKAEEATQWAKTVPNDKFLIEIGPLKPAPKQR